MLVTKMELKDYLLKENKRLEKELAEIETANNKENVKAFTPTQRIKEAIKDNNRLLKEKC